MAVIALFCAELAQIKFTYPKNFSQKCVSSCDSFCGEKYRKLLDTQGYHPNLLSRQIGLSEKPRGFVPLSTKFLSGPWTKISR